MLRKEQMMRKVLSVRRYKVGYEVREEQLDEFGDGTPVVMKSAYTVPEDYYIGNSVDAYRKMVTRGLRQLQPVTIDQEAGGGLGTTCAIGFQPEEQKWYGWSHRAICGFGIGSKVEKGDCCASSGWADECLEEHPEENLSLPVGFKAKTLGDAKRMARAFASAVS